MGGTRPPAAISLTSVHVLPVQVRHSRHDALVRELVEHAPQPFEQAHHDRRDATAGILLYRPQRALQAGVAGLRHVVIEAARSTRPSMRSQSDPRWEGRVDAIPASREGVIVCVYLRVLLSCLRLAPRADDAHLH